MSKYDALIQEIRYYYSMIYEWHHMNGLKRHKEKLISDQHEQPDDIFFRKYLKFLEQMPYPESADIDSMLLTAKEILSGCMEWSYWQKIKQDFSMCEAAKKIRSTIEQVENETNSNEKIHNLMSLQNLISDSPLEANSLSIPVSRHELNKEKYYEYSRYAYSDVIHIAEIENLGGYVALADTNLEYEERFNWSNREDSHICFRNSKAMNFTQDNSEDTLCALAVSGEISILSVKIGS